MARLPRIPTKLILSALYKAEFYIHHQSGSHIQLRSHARSSLRVTVPFTRKDLAPKTLRTIISQAGLSVDDFLSLLDDKK